LNQNQGFPLNFRYILSELQQASQFIFVPLDVDDALSYDSLARIPDSRGRMIATAAIKMDAPLLTVDREIIASGAVEVLE